MTKAMILLTKSKKLGGYCVAGIDVCNGQWIRIMPEVANDFNAVPEDDMHYASDKVMPEIYDIVRVEGLKYKPNGFQSENHTYVGRLNWDKMGKSSFRNLKSIRQYDEPETIFGGTEHSITPENIRKCAIDNSLLFLDVERPRVKVSSYRGQGKTVSMNFMYHGAWYNNFRITQIDLRDKYLGYEADLDKTYELEIDGKKYERIALAVSLAEKPDKNTGKHFKLAAQVLV